jgi:hypothetical protein
MLGIDILHEFYCLKEEQILDESFAICGMGEKFGKLTITCHNTSPAVVNLISHFSVKAERTCQDCGYCPASLHKRNNWLRVMCTDCATRSNYKLI